MLHLQIGHLYSDSGSESHLFSNTSSGLVAKKKDVSTEVKVLTLHQDRMTTGRRSGAVPQLRCIGGSGRYRFQPRTVQCLNMGSDGSDVQWKCKADMDISYSFGHEEVSCEGFDHPADPYILKASC